jgi:CcmD family protein
MQEGPANTVNYMIAGYVVIFSVILIYLVSLAIRNRNLKQDLEVLEDVDQKDQ